MAGLPGQLTVLDTVQFIRTVSALLGTVAELGPVYALCDQIRNKATWLLPVALDLT